MRRLLEGIEDLGSHRWLAHEGWNRIQKTAAAAIRHLYRKYDRWLANRRKDSRRLP